MNRQQAARSLVKLLAHLPRRQANTLAHLVQTVMHLSRFSLPELARTCQQLGFHYLVRIAS